MFRNLKRKDRRVTRISTMMDSVVVTNEGDKVENKMMDSVVVTNELMDAWDRSDLSPRF